MTTQEPEAARPVMDCDSTSSPLCSQQRGRLVKHQPAGPPRASFTPAQALAGVWITAVDKARGHLAVGRRPIAAAITHAEFECGGLDRSR